MIEKEINLEVAIKRGKNCINNDRIFFLKESIDKIKEMILAERI